MHTHTARVVAHLFLHYRLNQCVGELNHKYFLSFLVVNSVFLLYATYVVSLVLLSEVRRVSCVALLDDPVCM